MMCSIVPYRRLYESDGGSPSVASHSPHSHTSYTMDRI
jgi:hypothetical protein